VGEKRAVTVLSGGDHKKGLKKNHGRCWGRYPEFTGTVKREEEEVRLLVKRPRRIGGRSVFGGGEREGARKRVLIGRGGVRAPPGGGGGGCIGTVGAITNWLKGKRGGGTQVSISDLTKRQFQTSKNRR